MPRYICIHSHFYQPPRENPWLEEVEVQESAHPYHDWNQRVTAECYAPNTASRILDSDKRIIDIVNNYAKISFNFGPTLLSWMEDHEPQVYQAILEADRQSLKRFSGHGAAIAQVYNHMIMPLANLRDKNTQVIWGIKDFQHRFKRNPEGMWLAETAVDIETLEVLAQHDIKFTILAPHQARRVRALGAKDWEDVQGAKIDPQRAYFCHLPSGKKINLFFYDGPISQEIAFSDLLKNGERFAQRLLGVFPDENNHNRLVHIATDGETYGHHHRYGDMALAYCLHYIESNNLAKLTNYGEYLKNHPPAYEVEIVENSSWSCIHGVERWRADCGCCIGAHEGWHQAWRAPLRAAMDELRDRLAIIYEEKMVRFSSDIWQLRDQYIEVILNRQRDNVERFLRAHTQKGLDAQDKVTILKLLEMQRHAQLMYTSCGWFFDEISGIESTQIIQYAARAIQLAKEVSGQDLEKKFIQSLAKAPSNNEEIRDGAGVYARYVKTTKVDLLRVGAHYAISSLFENYARQAKVYCYTVCHELLERYEAGKQRIVFGHAHICSQITLEETVMSFCAFHFGDHNLNGGLRLHAGQDSFYVMRDEIKSAFLRSDIPEVLHLMQKHFGRHNYSLWHLFKQEQRKIFDYIFRYNLQEIEVHYRRIYRDYYPLMQARSNLGVQLPKVLENTVEFILSRDLFRLLQNEDCSMDQLGKTVDEISRWGFDMDKPALSYLAGKSITRFMEKVLERPKDISLLRTLERLLQILKGLSLDIDVGQAQNLFFKAGKLFYKERQKRAETDEDSREWIEIFDRIGDFLQVKIGP